eukprot:3973506-Alexandrium_andersonii.AAC.1
MHPSGAWVSMPGRSWDHAVQVSNAWSEFAACPCWCAQELQGSNKYGSKTAPWLYLGGGQATLSPR